MMFIFQVSINATQDAFLQSQIRQMITPIVAVSKEAKANIFICLALRSSVTKSLAIIKILNANLKQAI
jgi:tRNA U38,U39,U40 pseudouridine synthase TruA